MRKLIKKLSIKSAVSFFTTVLMLAPLTVFAAEYVVVDSTQGFWHVHNLINGLFFGLMLAVFPRLTLAFISLVTGTIGINLLGIIGWVVAPHVLVAYIATTLYWHTNPILVIIAWFIALGGETAEKTIIKRRF